MTLPNFMLVGAARSGTTALARMVHEHPDVFVSPRKECSYFVFEESPPTFTGPGDDYLQRMVITSWDEYQGLFAHTHGASAVGEASVYYLCQPQVFPRIRERLGNVRAIAILRNPVDRAFSAFGHAVRDGREREPTFEAALAREQQRIARGWEFSWHYRRLSSYADDVARLLDVFGRERVLLLRYDDFVTDPRSVLRAVFRFLGVDPNIDVSYDVRINPSGRPRSERVAGFLFRPSRFKDAMRPMVPDRLLQAVHRRLELWNTRPLELSPATREQLMWEFEPDVRRLGELTGLDVDPWLPALRRCA